MTKSLFQYLKEGYQAWSAGHTETDQTDAIAEAMQGYAAAIHKQIKKIEQAPHYNDTMQNFFTKCKEHDSKLKETITKLVPRMTLADAIKTKEMLNYNIGDEAIAEAEAADKAQFP